MTSASHTWCQLGLVLTLDELIAAGDSLVRRASPLCSIEDLARAVERHTGERGLGLARRALPAVRAGCDSPRETWLRLILVRAGLPEPTVNAVVSGPGARVRYGDLVYRRWIVIVEHDGEHHRKDSRQYAADIVRLKELALLGWTVIRVLTTDFPAPDSIVARVVTALRDHGWR